MLLTGGAGVRDAGVKGGRVGLAVRNVDRPLDPALCIQNGEYGAVQHGWRWGNGDAGAEPGRVGLAVCNLVGAVEPGMALRNLGSRG